MKQTIDLKKNTKSADIFRVTTYPITDQLKSFLLDSPDEWKTNMADNSKGGFINRTEKFLRRRKTKVRYLLLNSVDVF